MTCSLNGLASLVRQTGSRESSSRWAPLYDVPIPAEDVDGSQVYELMRDGRIEEVGEYVRSDVHLTRSLHCKLAGYFWS